MTLQRGGHTFKALRVPIRTSGHKSGKSHAVLVGTKEKPKLIRFGQDGVETNKNKKQRDAFRSRHKKNIMRGEQSAAYWANKVKWKGN